MIESERGADAIRLTELGAQIVDSQHERGARTKAFLNIPLFKKLYEHYKGKVLPPAAALQREMVTFGVAQKQADRARQIMERSAESAGFFESGRDRLVAPALGVPPATGAQMKPPENGGGSGSGNGLDPLIAALIQKLPEKGTGWPVDDRVMWLQMMAMAFQMTYGPTAEGINISKQS